MTALRPSRFILHRGVLIALVALLVALSSSVLGPGPAPVQAQTVSNALLSNLDETRDTFTRAFASHDVAHQFTTGLNETGYLVSSASLHLNRQADFGQMKISIRTVQADQADHFPTETVLAETASITSFDEGLNTFTFTTPAYLEPNTRYALVVDDLTTNTLLRNRGRIRYSSTTNDTSSFGWDGVTSYWRAHDATGVASWTTELRRHVAYRLDGVALTTSSPKVNINRDSARDIDVTGAAEFGATSIWSDGTTLWVVPRTLTAPTKVLAYTVATKQRDDDKDIDLVSSQNSNPGPIWSDGEIMWVLDRDDWILYAYTLAANTYAPTRNITLQPSSKQRTPRGVYFDQSTIWVSGHAAGVIESFNLDGTPAERDIPLQGGNQSASGISGYLGILYVVDGGHREIFTYDLENRFLSPYHATVKAQLALGENTQGLWVGANGAFTTQSLAGSIKGYSTRGFYYAKHADISKPSGSDLRGLWSDGSLIYVANNAGNNVLVYDTDAGKWDGNKAITTLTGPLDVWSDGTTLWVVNGKALAGVYAYNPTTRKADSSKDYPDLLYSNQVYNPEGFASDGTKTYFVAFLSASNDADLVEYGDPDMEPLGKTDIHSTLGSNTANSVWHYDGVTYVITDTKAFAYDGITRNASKDITFSSDYGIPSLTSVKGMWQNEDATYLSTNRGILVFHYTLHDFEPAEAVRIPPPAVLPCVVTPIDPSGYGSHTNDLTDNCESFFRDRPAYAHHFSFSITGEHRQTVAFTLESDDFDAFLYIAEGTSPDNAADFDQNDDQRHPCSENSRLVKELDPGDYILEVTTYHARDTGRYVLAYGPPGLPPAKVRVPPEGCDFPPPPEPAGPVTVTVSAVPGNVFALDVSWNEVEDAWGYVVEWKADGQEYSESERRHSTGDYSGSVTSYRIRELYPGTTYMVRVTARHYGGDSVSEARGTTLALPSAGLSGLTVVPITSSDPALDVSWPPVTGAARYVVQWKSEGQDYSDTERTHTTTDTSYRIEGLIPGTSYDVRVTVQLTAEASATTNGSPSTEPTPTPEPVPPATIQGFGFTARPVYTGGDTYSIYMEWDPVGGADSYEVTWTDGPDGEGNRRTYRSTVRGKTWNIVQSTDPSPPRLGLTYDIKIEAKGPSGAVLAEDSAQVHLPVGAPFVEGVEVVTNPADPTTVRVVWQSVPGATGYRIEGKEGTDPWPWSPFVSFPEGMRINEGRGRHAGSLLSIKPDTRYTVRVTALQGETELAIGEAVGRTRVVFGGVSAQPVTGHGDQLEVSWSALDGDYVYYVYYKRTGSGDAETRVTNRGVSPVVITGLTPGTQYTIRVAAEWVRTRNPNTGMLTLVSAGEATVTGTPGSTSGEPGGQEPPVGTAELTVLAMPPASDEPTQLDVFWDWVETAAKYHVRWKTGSGGYGDAQQATTNSYTITGLTAGTSYTVQVSALDGDNTLLAEGEADGTTAPRTSEAGDETPNVLFVIYHDRDAGDEAVDRYNQAIALLDEAGILYNQVFGDLQDKVDQLAGVTGSVLPRFFYGDPTAEDWVSEPGENNGGLRWLKEKVTELSSG